MAITEGPANQKEDLNRALTETEVHTICSVSGKLAGIATCTSPRNALHVSLDLQRHKEDPHTPLAILPSRHQDLTNVMHSSLDTLENIALDNQSIHHHVYPDAYFQNL